MKDIPGFTIDHEHLEHGAHVSRRDFVGGQVVTTSDIHMKAPNHEPVPGLSALHTIEHLVATYPRNGPEWRSRTIYWGSMGYLTGNYLIIVGDLNPLDIADLPRRASAFMAHYEGTVPGVAPCDCGSYRLHSLKLAREESRRYLEKVLEHLDGTNTHYLG